MKRFKTRLALILAMVVAATLFAGCSSSDGSTESSTPESNTNTTNNNTNTTNNNTNSTKGGKVIVGISGNPSEFFTPYKQGTLTSYGWTVYEPLAWDKSTGFESCLAESWELDAENNTLTVKLKEGIFFSNGDPLDADDVVFTLTCRQDYGTYGLIGNPSTVEAVDQYTVRVVWDEFSLNFETWILTQYIYSKETFEEKGLDWMLNNMVGTGPYVQSEYIPDVHLTFVRNENYRSTDVPGPDEFEWVVIADNTAMVSAFINGEINVINNWMDLPTTAMLEAEGFTAPNPPVATSMQYYCIPISVNSDDPLSNQAVRTAVYNGVDWDSMATTCHGNNAYHTDALGFKLMPYYQESLEKSDYNVEAAKSALADAGYPDGFETTLYTTVVSEIDATFLQSELIKLGIDAKVSMIDFAQMGDYLTGKAADSGIVLTGTLYYMSNQTDRYVKFTSPVGQYKDIIAYDNRLNELWSVVPASSSMDELNNNLYAYTDALINEYGMIYPMCNAPTLNFYQNWITYNDGAYTISCGFDPFGIFAEEH